MKLLNNIKQKQKETRFGERCFSSTFRLLIPSLEYSREQNVHDNHGMTLTRG